MQDVRDIAKWFLSKESMTHKKLQKLCYYAQAWYCALYDGAPLFGAEIQAWVHGPVIPALYAEYSVYGWDYIPQEDEISFNDKVLDILNAVYDTYGPLDGNQLEKLTHSEAPWRNARGTLKPLELCTNVISCETMRNYYKKKYESEQND